MCIAFISRVRNDTYTIEAARPCWIRNWRKRNERCR